MKKGKSERDDDEMRAEYDFSKGVTGKYAKLYARGSNIVKLDPDVAEFFPDSHAVNDALRSLATIARRHGRKVG